MDDFEDTFFRLALDYRTAITPDQASVAFKPLEEFVLRLARGCAAGPKAIEILNTAWIAVPLEFRDSAKLLDPDDPLPQAVRLMAKALLRHSGECMHERTRWNHDQSTGQCQICNAVFPGPPKHPRGELYNPDSLL